MLELLCPSWSKGVDLRSTVVRLVGSNPTGSSEDFAFGNMRRYEEIKCCRWNTQATAKESFRTKTTKTDLCGGGLRGAKPPRPGIEPGSSA